MKTNIFKSIGIILIGFIINALLSVITDFLLEAIGVLPNPQKGLFDTWAIILVLSYRAIYTALTGFVVARLAPSQAMTHAVILAFIGTTITILAVNHPSFSDKAPMWYGYTLAIITFPFLWLGVKIQQSWREKETIA